MKFSHALVLASTLAFFACGDDDSSSTGPSSDPQSSESKAKSSDSKDKSSESKAKFDCTVSGGVKVVSPAAGDEFKIGDTITVVFGSDVEDSGYRIEFKKDKDSKGKNMGLDGSVGPESPDGKTCYEVDVVLDEEWTETSDEAVIRVIPYNKTSKGANSEAFKVSE